MGTGSHEKMIEDSVRVNSGHLQVTGLDYVEKRTLEQFVVYDASLAEEIDRVPGVVSHAPRIVSFGLASRDSSTRGVAVLGVDPAREGGVTTLPGRIREGAFLSDFGTGEVVLGERLAAILGAGIGDEVLLYSVAYSLETAYALFRVSGIVKFPEAGMDRSLLVMSLSDAQDFFVYGDRVSEVAIIAENSDAVPQIQAALSSALENDPVAVHTWRETMPELDQIIFLDDAGMYIMLFILVVVVGFGILNTILMAVLERRRELGVVLALGLRPGAVFRIVYLESLMLAALGLVVGLGIALPLVLWLQANPFELTGEAVAAMELFGVEPVMTWKLKLGNPIGSSLTILGVAVLAALYPALKASRGRPVDGLRSL